MPECDIPVYQYIRKLSVSDHQCAPFCPVIPPQAALNLAHAPQQTDEDTKAEADEKSKMEYQYDRYFTYQNKIYSFFTAETGDEIVTMLCNFAVYPDGIEQVVDRSGTVTKLLRLIIGCSGQSCNITIQPYKTEKLIKEIQKQIPQAYLNPNEKRAAKQLSAYISMIFEHLKDDFNDISANFNDTMTALEIKMGSTKDEVLLVDDYRPSALRTEAARMNNNFEKLIRFYGDGTGKGRGNAQLGLRSEFKPNCCMALRPRF